MQDDKPKKHVIIPHLRWWIGGLLFLSTVINYIDRQTLSFLAPYLKKEFTWSNSDFALIIIAFRFAYAFAQGQFARGNPAIWQTTVAKAGFLSLSYAVASGIPMRRTISDGFTRGCRPLFRV